MGQPLPDANEAEEVSGMGKRRMLADSFNVGLAWLQWDAW